MWVIAKVKKKNLEIFKKELEKKMKSKVTFYFPKVLIKKRRFDGNIKIIIKNLLGNYIFCHFQNLEAIRLCDYKFTRGLDYFLFESLKNQKSLYNFINLCKSKENKDGSISSEFFINFNLKKFKFINGPFHNNFFQIIKIYKKKIIAELSNKTKIVINKKDNYLFESI